MHEPTRSNQSELRAAIERLSRFPATAIRDDTHLRLPVTMTIGDADLCTYLARNNNSFLFLPNFATFRTQLILGTTTEAWQQDKLPVLAVCPTVESATALQKATGIESVAADRFFDNLQLAHCVHHTFTNKKSYVIGHDYNPAGRFDHIVLPSRANVVVYEAEAFTGDQLTVLCDRLAEVHGRLVLCGNWNAIDLAHPDIARAISDALGHGLPDESLGDDPKKTWELGTERRKPPAKELGQVDSVATAAPEDIPPAQKRSFLVFHAKSDDARFFPNDFKLVAKINANSIDQAVTLSQHDRLPWTENPGVTAFDESPRSTQVGDVVIDHDCPKRYLGSDGWSLATTEMATSPPLNNPDELATRIPQPRREDRQSISRALKL